MQDRKQAVTIPLPNLGASPLCPIKAVQQMIQLVSAEPNGPLFLVPRTSRLVPLTDSVKRKFQMHYMSPLPSHFMISEEQVPSGPFNKVFL